MWSSKGKFHYHKVKDETFLVVSGSLRLDVEIEGVVRQKTKGRGQPWWVFVSHNGKRRSKKVGDRKAALAIARQIEEKLAAGSFQIQPQKQIPTFKEVSDRYFKLLEGAEMAPKTLSRYDGILRNHIIPKFGNREITNITRADIADFLSEARKEGYAVSDIELRLTVLNGTFNRALSEGLIDGLPTVNIKKEIRLKRKSPEPNPLTFDESEKILTTIEKHFQQYDFLHSMVFTALKAGLRLGELLGLRWGDIDFDEKQIYIQRTFDREFGPPKSKKNRRVDMTDSLIEVLKGHMLNEKKKGLRIKLGTLPEQVFTNQYGRVLQQNHIRYVWAKVLKKAKVEFHKFHSTRATFASQLLSLGADIYYVSKQLGHHSVKITESQYAKFIPVEGRAPQVNLLDEPTCSLPTPAHNKKAVTN